MSLWLTLTCLLFTSGICVLIVGMMRAPIGYEDENGFHATTRPTKVASPAPVPVALPVRMHEMSGHT
jgi:hypothetical protein